MLKVVLIDDKKSIVEGMKYLIEWEEYGFEIAAALRCAADAIDFVKQNHVDLIISDIRMPGISGLELIQTIKKTDPHIKFIIISGYAEFEYVKKAMDYQANGYLLKPIDEDELITLLIRVKDEIFKENEYIKHQRDKYIHEVLLGDFACDGNNREFENDIDLRYVLIRFFDDKMITSRKRHNDDTAVKVFNELRAFVDESAYISKNDNGCIEMIIGSHIYKNNIRGYCMEIEKCIKEVAECDFAVFVGKEVDCIENIKYSRETAKKTEAAAFYASEKSIFIYDTDGDISFSQTLSDMSFCSNITDRIKNSDAQALAKAVDEFCLQVKKECVNPETVFVYIYNIIFDIGNKADSSGGDVVKFFYRYSLLKKSDFVNFKAVSAFVKENALELQKFLGELKMKNSLGIIGEVVDYIGEHYMDKDLKLQKIADKYYINSAYLGTMFKERMGKSFNTYLLDIRIEKSKELLKNSNAKIYEIALEVGFNDPNYFYVKFAEKVNMTAAAYRESFNKKNNHENNTEGENI
ncbi:MAG: response regulator [Clostridia bacterium]|nr:response regulator [Clostridia bacterium]